MLQLKCDQLLYFNSETMEPSDKDDPKAIEFVHFWFKGQSFLYNQIRKMIGSLIQKFRGGMEPEFQTNTMNENKMDIALAPGDGLMLEMVCYDSFNKSNKVKEPIRVSLSEQKQQVEEFRTGII